MSGRVVVEGAFAKPQDFLSAVLRDFELGPDTACDIIVNDRSVNSALFFGSSADPNVFPWPDNAVITVVVRSDHTVPSHVRIHEWPMTTLDVAMAGGGTVTTVEVPRVKVSNGSEIPMPLGIREMMVSPGPRQEAWGLGPMHENLMSIAFCTQCFKITTFLGALLAHWSEDSDDIGPGISWHCPDCGPRASIHCGRCMLPISPSAEQHPNTRPQVPEDEDPDATCDISVWCPECTTEVSGNFSGG